MVNKNPNYSNEYFGMSTDTKPTDALNASRFYEIDTSDVYMFDEEGKQWFKQNSNASSESGGSGDGSGSSSGCFWDNPAVVAYLSAGIDARGSILNVVNQAVQANLANNLNKYLQKQTLEIRFPAAEGYSGYPFAVLPCSIFVETLESEDEVEVRFMTSAGSYTYTGFLDYIGYHDTETDSTHYDYGDVDINVIKCAIPEIENDSDIEVQG